MKASPELKAQRKQMYHNLRAQGMSHKRAFRTVGNRFPVKRSKGRKGTFYGDGEVRRENNRDARIGRKHGITVKTKRQWDREYAAGSI